MQRHPDFETQRILAKETSRRDLIRGQTERASMIRKIAVTSLCSLVLWTAATANAADFMQRFRREPGQAAFTAHETTFDLFGSLKVPENDGFSDGDLGLGFGANYFLTRYFGAGADSRIDEFDWPNHINLS